TELLLCAIQEVGIRRLRTPPLDLLQPVRNLSLSAAASQVAPVPVSDECAQEIITHCAFWTLAKLPLPVLVTGSIALPAPGVRVPVADNALHFSIKERLQACCDLCRHRAQERRDVVQTT